MGQGGDRIVYGRYMGRTVKRTESLTVAFPLFIKNRPKHFMYHTKVSFAGGSHEEA